MGVKDQIRSTDEYEAIQRANEATQATSGGQQSPQSAAGGQRGTTVGDSLGPVLDWEKTDVEFWLQVAQVVLLYLLLRELRGGGR